MAAGFTPASNAARYAHLGGDAVKEAAARVADAIGADILPEHMGTGGGEAADGPDGGRPSRRH